MDTNRTGEGKTLEIRVSDKSTVTDYLETYKKWIGKLKHFYTVKVLPPRQD